MSNLGMWGAAVLGLGLVACGSSEFEPKGNGKDDAGLGGASGNGGAAGAGGTAGSTGGTAGNPSGDPNGAPCKAGASCKTGFCADDVCCDSACDGACESCSLSGSQGTCSPHPAGTDPESECGGTDAECAGKCSGSSGCSYPGIETACGTGTCTAGTATLDACDSAGACKSQEKPCTPYTCDTSDCKSTCASDTDCVDETWCNGVKCDQKKPNGSTCNIANECTSGFCIDKVCCNVDCKAPASCATGKCTCSGEECATNDSCVLFYQDSDGDGYGNPLATKPACKSKGTSGYVSDKTDCYDKNKDAHPGQTAYFIGHRGDNSFDYNCVNGDEKQYGNVAGKACVTCTCLPGICAGSFGCTNCVGPAKGYSSDVACGQMATLNVCSSVKDPTLGTCITGPYTVPNTPQPCH